MSGAQPGVIELREPNAARRRVEIDVDGSIEVGRDCGGVDLDDPKVSRRHLLVTARGTALVVDDLGSSNGTRVNGIRISGPTEVHVNDSVVIGGTTILVVRVPAPPLPSPAPVAPAPVAPVPVAPPPAPAAPAPPTTPRPALDELATRAGEGIVVRYRPGTPGERAAASVLGAAKRARRQLAGLGSEPWGAPVQICLVDPFPDPADPSLVVAAGTVVDPARNEIWMVVTPESPPEAPARSLALLFGAALPAADVLSHLVEGYGLVVAGVPRPDDVLRGADLPSFDEAEGEQRSLMAHSFVAHVVDRAGVPALVRFLGTARPGQLDRAAEDSLDATLAALEEQWREALEGEAPKVPPRQFLRMARRYLRPHVWRQAEMSVYLLAGLAFTVVFPFVLRRLFDHALPSKQFSQVVRLLVTLGAALSVSMLAELRRSYLSARISAAVVRDLRTEMFEKLHALPSSWFDRNPQGDVMARVFSDVPAIEFGISQTLQDGIFQIVSVVVAGIVAFELNAVLAVITVVGAPLVAVVYRVMSKGAEERSRAVHEETGTTMSVAGESIGAQGVVKAFGLDGRERARFRRTQDRLFTKTVRLSLFGGLFKVSVSLIMLGLQIAVLALGSWLILHGRLTPGGLIAFVGVMNQVIQPVTQLSSLGQELQSASGALTRVNEVLDAVPAIADRSDARTLAPLARDIVFDDVIFSYRGDRPALDGLSFRIAAGTRVAFVGPTGAGKSSVLQLIERFYDVDEGAVRFDGLDIRDVTIASLRAQIGIVFQESVLFDTTVRDNIAIGRPDATDADVEAAARQAEVHDDIMKMPKGYDTPVGERGGRLSGGQRQRLAIARAIVRNPRVLLLDEATSALDARTERLVAATLERIGAGRTTISVTHRLGSIVAYDRIFVVVAGRIAEEGTHAELLARGGTYAELWSEQTGAPAPATPAVDARAALASIPVLGALPDDTMAALVAGLRKVDLAEGATLGEDVGIAVVVRGRPQVVRQGTDGRPVPVSALGPGDAFGVAAALGNDSGAWLLASSGPVGLLVLDREAVAMAVPDGAAAVRRAEHGAVAPVGGVRLSRATIVPVRPVAAPWQPPAVAARSTGWIARPPAVDNGPGRGGA